LAEGLTAPVSRRPCVAYELIVEQKRSSRALDGTWWHVLARREAVPFLVTSHAGRVEVHPDGHYVLDLTEDRIDKNGWLGPSNVELFGNLVTELRLAGLYDDTTSFRYREAVLEAGESVAVYGVFRREVRPDGEPGDSRRPPEVAVLRGTELEPLSITDEPRRAFRD
jgi:hypothetical protein